MNWVFADQSEECNCQDKLHRNAIYSLGLMRWRCPEHGIVQPDIEGNCIPVHIAPKVVRPSPKPRTLNEFERLYQMRFGIHNDG